MSEEAEENQEETKEEQEQEEIEESDEESELESLAQDTQFHEFIQPTESSAPVIQTDSLSIESPIESPSIELETLSDEGISGQREQEEEQEQYISVYNAPDYNETEMPQASEMRERNTIVSPQEMFNQSRTSDLRPMKIDSWHEMHNIKEGHEDYEVVAEAKPRQEKDNLPFQQKRKEYQPKKR